MYERLRRFPGAGQNDRREGWKCNGTPHRKRLGWRRDHVPPAIGPVIRWPCCGARIGRMVGEQATVHPRPTRTTSNPAGLYRTEPGIGPDPAFGPDNAGNARHRRLQAFGGNRAKPVILDSGRATSVTGSRNPGTASRGGFRACCGAGSLNTGRTGLFSGTPGGGAGSDTAGKSAAPTRAATGRAIGNASKLRDRSGAGVAHARHCERGACTLADQALETA